MSRKLLFAWSCSALILYSFRRAAYHETRNYLYTENRFCFDNFASELRLINKPIGLTRCRLNGCEPAVCLPYFKELILDIGDDNSFENGLFVFESMQCSLKAMKYQLYVDKLVLFLRRHGMDCMNMFSFAKDLQKIKTGNCLVIGGDASKYSEINICDLAIDMGMKRDPHWLFPDTKKNGKINGPVFSVTFCEKS